MSRAASQGAHRRAAELAMRQEYGPIGGWNDKNHPADYLAATRTAREAGAPIYDTNAFGVYDRDSANDEHIRDVHQTMEALGDVNRILPVQSEEIDAIKQRIAVEKEKKWRQYWASQMDPARPWTMAEVAKVAPEVAEGQMEAIAEIAQYTMDVATLKHLGHGGNPRLAQLQYMMDNGMMDHMPDLNYVTDPGVKYQFGPASIVSWFSAIDTDNKDGLNTFKAMGMPRSHHALDKTRFGTDKDGDRIKAPARSDSGQTIRNVFGRQ